MTDSGARARAARGRDERWLPIVALLLVFGCLALGAATTTGPVASLDTSVLLALAPLRDTALGAVLGVYQRLGELVPFLVLLAVPAAVLVARRRPVAAAVVLSGFAASVLSGVVKLLFATARPPGGELLDVLGEPSFAYPSGHTTRAVVAFGLIGLALLREARAARRGPATTLAVAVAVTALAVAMAVGRIVSGQHWLSDVVGGALLGGAWLALAAWRWPRSDP